MGHENRRYLESKTTKIRGKKGKKKKGEKTQIGLF